MTNLSQATHQKGNFYYLAFSEGPESIARGKLESMSKRLSVPSKGGKSADSDATTLQVYFGFSELPSVLPRSDVPFAGCDGGLGLAWDWLVRRNSCKNLA